jgi:hypothetical protein
MRLFAVAVLAVILVASFFSPAAAFTGIMITKVTTNGDTTTVFEFTISNDIVQIFDLIGGESQIVAVVSGSYTLTEKVPDGWFITDISCEGVVGVPEPSTFTFIPGEGVIIHYVANDAVTCTFTNSPTPPEAPPVGGAVIPANTLAILGPWLGVIGLVGCIGTAVVVAKKRQS